MLRNRGFVLLLFLANCVSAEAQILEYGKPDELKDVRSVYIYTGTELEVRENMVKQISKKIPTLEIADRPENADVLLLFSADSSTFLANVATTTYSASPGMATSNSTPQYHTVQIGTGTVVKLLGPNRIRLLAQFQDSRKTVFEHRTSTNVANDFVEAYLKANGKKK